MNKAEIIDRVAESADISKASATRAVDAFLGAITTSLSQSEEVALVGFGTFGVKERPARAGRNPRTGESITINAARVPVFRPGKALRDAI